MRKILLPITLLAGTLAYAGGFRVSLQGVKQLAMAHTSAHTEDASVAFFNPAGMSFIPSKLSVVAGGFGVASKVSYQNLDTGEAYSTENPLGTPIYAAVAYKVVDNVSVGFSFTTPFGSTVQWPEKWTGDEIVTKMSLKSYFFQPAVSVKMADWMSVGLSYIYVKGQVNWDKKLNKFNGSLNLKDDKAKGHGLGLGFYFRPTDKLDVSIAYRSPVNVKANDGVVSFNVSSALYSALKVDANGQDRFKAELPLVEEYTIGATYRITPKWQVSADFNYTGWSRYDALTLDFENALIGNQKDKTVLKNLKNFKNTQTWRFGTQYQFTDMIAGRLGYYYDQSPYEDKDFIPETPSFDNNVITAGIGLKFNKFNVDISGGYAFMKRRNSMNDNLGFYGQLKSKAAYFGLGLSYNPF
jgi:outer membrane protein P1, putative